MISIEEPYYSVVNSDDKRNPNFIAVTHGKLIINVPRKIFHAGTLEIDKEEAEKFISNLSSRYPWLTENALKVVMDEAKEAMGREIGARMTAHEKARKRISKGDLRGALALIEKHLVSHPEDADAWYVAGELLCKMGKMDQGYKAMNRARDLSKY